MSREEIEKLLGGYATGTLTPEERDALFAAALEDQQLFEELAREEPLRELLQDPVAQTRLRAALERKPEPGYLRWLRPAAWAIPALGLAAIVVVFVVQRQAARTVMTAQAPALPRMGPVEPVPSALPQNLEKRALPLLARPVKAVPTDALKRQEAPAQAKDAPEQVDALAVTGQAAPVAPAAPAPAPPPPPAAPVAAPLNPPAAAQQVIVQAGQAQFGVQSQQIAAGQAPGRVNEAVQLGAAGGFVSQQDARELFFGQPNVPLVQSNVVEREQLARRKAVASAAPVARVSVPVSRQIGLRYSIQRRLANGQTAAVIPNEVLGAGDQITLKLEPNDAGYLSVFERAAGAWREISSMRVERLTSYTVPARGSLAFDPSGAIDLFVVLSREARQTPYPVPEARLDQATSVNFQERLTYVVTTASLAQGQVVAFPITLSHK
jgi:hypothetical protein